MKIVVVHDKHGNQYNFDVTGLFFKEDEVIKDYFEPTDEFMNYFEEVTNKTVDSFYFDYVYWVDTDNLIHTKQI